MFESIGARYLGEPFDDSMGEPSAKAAHSALASGRWAEVETVFRQSDLPRRLLIVEKIASDEKSLDRLEKLGKNSSTSLWQLLWGTSQVSYAWRVRSGLDARYVQKEQFERFWGILLRAKEVLLACVNDGEQTWSEGLTWLIKAEKGLQNPESAQGAWTTLEQFHPGHTVGALAYLELIAPKWYGSREQVLTFIEEMCHSHPENPTLLCLWAAGHAEIWVSESMEDATTSLGYWNVNETRKQVLEAWHQWTATQSAQQDEWHPWCEVAWQNFAFALSQMGERQFARQAFSKQRVSKPLSKPWIYSGSNYYRVQRILLTGQIL